MKTLKRISAMVSLAIMMLMMNITAFADGEAGEGGGGLEGSILVTGTKKLISDATGILTVNAVIITGLLVLIFLIARGAADEQDKKPWDKRIKSALVCGILATIAVPTIGTILSYYS